MLRRFIPAADEVARLQRGKDTESKLFQAFAEQGPDAQLGRHELPRLGPVGVVMQLASSRPDERVAPARIWNYRW